MVNYPSGMLQECRSDLALCPKLGVGAFFEGEAAGVNLPAGRGGIL